MKKYGKRTVARALAFLCALALSGTVSLTVYAYPGTIGTDNVNVRASASTGADVVTRLNSGASIEIEGEEVDASNATWYKISVNGQTGYVRADLVNTTGGGNAATGTSTANAGTSTSTQTPTQAQTLSDRNATVNTADINVRSGAGRDYASAGTLALNATVTVTGEATDTSGAKWYRIRYNGTSEGYVLADFLDVEAPATPDPATTGTTDDPAGGASTTPDTSAPVTEAPDATKDDGLMGKQYTVAYEPGDDGQETPYLVDNNSRSKWSVTTLINDYNELVRLQGVEKANGRWKLLSLILGILTIAAVALLAVTLIRYRRLSDGGFTAASYEDDDEDDEDDDYEEAPRRRGGLFGRRKETYDDEDEEDDEEDDDDYDEPPRKRGGGLFARFKKKRYEDDDEEDDYDDEEDDYDDAPHSSSTIRRVYTPERSSADDRTASRARARSMSFDDDDDDMSFRFMDND